jgi:hypothetical protein
MTELDLDTMRAREVQPVTVPVPWETFRELKDLMQTDPTGEGVTNVMTVNGLRTLGTWVIVGLREDYALQGNRTYWVTMRWEPPRG